MTEKEQFIEAMKARTKKFAIDTINFCETLKNCNSSRVITYQLVKSATSTGANYRASCRARSAKEFYSKLCIVAEEIDESEYWLQLILDTQLSTDEVVLTRLIIESNAIIKIISSAKSSMYRKLN
jgi:four helix bundle protein